MTVSYSFDVSRNSWAAVMRVIFRWRGSVWKSLWKELVVWLILYYMVMFVYRSPLILDQNGKHFFELLNLHVRARMEWIPLNFLLGFFVTMVIDRWRQVFMNLGFIENIALSVSTFFRQKERDDVLGRRAVVRYMCLAQVLVLRDISLKVRKRFPNLDAIVKAGKELFRATWKNTSALHTRASSVPINWACAISIKARETGRILNDNPLNGLLQEIKSFRSSLQLLLNFDWVPVPLAYPQLVFCAVRSYFVLCLIARQYIIGADAINKSSIDLLFPIITVLQFTFYVGWMKSLLNPLGEDDDHFECNYLIDRNIQTALAIVDDTFDYIPKLVMDRFKEQPKPMYSEDTVPKEPECYPTFSGSVAHLKLVKDDDKVNMVPYAAGEVEETQLTRRRQSLSNRIGSIVKKRINESKLSTSSNAMRPSPVPVSQCVVTIPESPNPATRKNSKYTRDTPQDIYCSSHLNYSCNSIDTTDFSNPFMSSFLSDDTKIHERTEKPTQTRRGSLYLDVVSEEASGHGSGNESKVGSPHQSVSNSHNNSDSADEKPIGVGPLNERRNTLALPLPSEKHSPTPRGILKKRPRISEPGVSTGAARVCRSEPPSRDPAFFSPIDEREGMSIFNSSIIIFIESRCALHDLLRLKLLNLENDDVVHSSPPAPDASHFYVDTVKPTAGINIPPPPSRKRSKRDNDNTPH